MMPLSSTLATFKFMQAMKLILNDVYVLQCCFFGCCCFFPFAIKRMIWLSLLLSFFVARNAFFAHRRIIWLCWLILDWDGRSEGTVNIHSLHTFKNIYIFLNWYVPEGNKIQLVYLYTRKLPAYQLEKISVRLDLFG